MNINKLIPTHCDVRDHSMVLEMAEFVKEGGIFNKETLDSWKKQHKDKKCSDSLIALSKFPDDLFFVHDGHHRILALFIAGRLELYPEEYQVTNWKYEDYLDINFENNWLTPFDPRTEVRIPEFFTFKDQVWDVYNHQSAEHARHLILTRPDKYKQPRECCTFQDLSLKCLD